MQNAPRQATHSEERAMRSDSPWILLPAGAWIIGGFVQINAAADGLEWIGLPGVLAWTVALLTTWIPGPGMILAAIGAIKAWQWPLWGAVLLVMPQIAIVPLGLLAERLARVKPHLAAAAGAAAPLPPASPV
jgi:hypothetical protein